MWARTTNHLGFSSPPPAPASPRLDARSPDTMLTGATTRTTVITPKAKKLSKTFGNGPRSNTNDGGGGESSTGWKYTRSNQPLLTNFVPDGQPACAISISSSSERTRPSPGGKPAAVRTCAAPAIRFCIKPLWTHTARHVQSG